MRRSIKCVGAVLAAVITQLVTAAALAPGLPIPKFKRGTWSTSVDEQITGSQIKHSESTSESCYDPADSVRNGLVSAVNEWMQSQTNFSY
jgi:hypothetical protein